MNHPLRDWLEYAGLTAAAWFVGLLGYGTLKPLADFVGTTVFILDTRGRRTAVQNLSSAFPGRHTKTSRLRIAMESYRSFARTMLELLWSPNVTAEFIQKRVVFEGPGLEYQKNNPACPAVFCCLHFSNFEWLSIALAYEIGTGPVIAQKFKNPLLGPVFDRLRASTGNVVIPQERAMVKMLKHLKSGGKFGILVDLNISPKEGGVAVETFGGLMTCLTPAHVALAQRTGAVVIPLECRPSVDGLYRMFLHEPIECPPASDPIPLVKKCWDALEPAIHSQPACWLWPYKHWRYKPSPESTRYPAYSNYSAPFGKLVSASRTPATN